jgi:hypothetical protein
VGDSGDGTRATARFCGTHRRHLTLVSTCYGDAALYTPPPRRTRHTSGRPRVQGQHRASPLRRWWPGIEAPAETAQLSPAQARGTVSGKTGSRSVGCTSMIVRVRLATSIGSRRICACARNRSWRAIHNGGRSNPPSRKVATTGRWNPRRVRASQQSDALRPISLDSIPSLSYSLCSCPIFYASPPWYDGEGNRRRRLLICGHVCAGPSDSHGCFSQPRRQSRSQRFRGHYRQPSCMPWPPPPRWPGLPEGRSGVSVNFRPRQRAKVELRGCLESLSERIGIGSPGGHDAPTTISDRSP